MMKAADLKTLSQEGLDTLAKTTGGVVPVEGHFAEKRLGTYRAFYKNGMVFLSPTDKNGGHCIALGKATKIQQVLGCEWTQAMDLATAFEASPGWHIKENLEWVLVNHAHVGLPKFHQPVISWAKAWGVDVSTVATAKVEGLVKAALRYQNRLEWKQKRNTAVPAPAIHGVVTAEVSLVETQVTQPAEDQEDPAYDKQLREETLKARREKRHAHRQYLKEMREEKREKMAKLKKPAKAPTPPKEGKKDNSSKKGGQGKSA